GLQRVLRPSIGDGILSSEGAFHRQQRKLMTPPFQPRHITSYAELMGQYGEEILRGWEDGAVIDIHQQMTNVTMSIIGKALFDADLMPEANDLAVAMIYAFSYVSHALSQLFPPPYHWPLPRNRRMHQTVALVRRRIQSFIDERRNQPRDRNDLLSVLLQTRY